MFDLNEHRPSIRYRKAPAVKAGQGRADYESEWLTIKFGAVLVALTVLMLLASWWAR